MLIDLVQFADVVLLVTAGVLALIAAQTLVDGLPFGEFAVTSIIAAAVVVARLRSKGFYALQLLHHAGDQCRAAALALVPGGAIAAICLSVLRVNVLVIAAWLPAWFVTSLAILSLLRGVLAVRIGAWRRAGRLDRKVAVIGVNELSEAFVRRVQEDRTSSTRIVGIYDDENAHSWSDQAVASVRGDLETLVLDCRLHEIDAIAIALPSSEAARIQKIFARLRSCVADVYLVSDVCRLPIVPSRFEAIGANPVISMAPKPLSDWREIQKAAFDRVAAALLLIALLPLLCVTAVMIRLDSKGPILFRQLRMGFNNNLFHIYKFRTMHHHMTDRLADTQTSRNDRRVTRVGRILRKLSIDELPQLLNVLRGDMSLVGPRPHAPATRLGARRVDEVVETYAQRHRVKPGITGLAQINGYRGEMSTDEHVRKRVQFDIEYIENWSMFLDVKILLLTAIREIRSRHAY